MKSRRRPNRDRPRKPPGWLRVQVDLDELEPADFVKLHLPNRDNIQLFDVIITPNEGYWADIAYTFKVSIPDVYPYKPPEV